MKKSYKCSSFIGLLFCLSSSLTGKFVKATNLDVESLRYKPAIAISSGGGVVVGNGGDVVDCYLPITGKRFLWSMEYFLALQIQAAHVDRLIELKNFDETLDEESAIQFFFKKLSLAPDFHDKVLKAYDILTNVPPGIVESLKDLPDDGFFINLPQLCLQRQAIIRRSHQLYWDAEVYKKIDFKQKAILIIHEAIYMVGVEHYQHTDSTKTQDLIVSLLTLKQDEKTLNSFLQSFFVTK